MSVFRTDTHEGSRPRFSMFRALAVAGALTAVFLVARPDGPQVAMISDTITASVAPVPSPSPTPTVFPEPIAVSWEGRLLRTLAGGRGIELESPEAPGGIFVAYAPDGITMPEEHNGVLLVHGQWIGISCEYGHCVPELDVSTVEAVPVEAE